MIIWLNGTLQNASEARIDPADRGLTLGDGLFETIAVRGGKALRLEAHMARLHQGCEVLRFSFPTVDFFAAIETTLTANKISEAVTRLTVTRGVSARGLSPTDGAPPTVMITVSPLPKPLPPARCVVAAVTRRNEHSPLSRIKSTNYLDNILARHEAIDRGGDEAILLNMAGIVAEVSVANLFAVKSGCIMTPPVKDGALPGIMRAAVLAASGGIEQSLHPEDLAGMDEVFLTNSLGIRPVVSINGKAVGKNQGGLVAGMITAKLKDD